MAEQFYDFLSPGGGGDSSKYLTYLNWKATKGSGGGFFETRSRPDADGDRSEVRINIDKDKGLVFYVDGSTIQQGYRKFADRWVDWGWVRYGSDPAGIRPPDEEFAKTTNFQGVQIPDPPKPSIRMRVWREEWVPGEDVDQILEWTTNQMSVLNEPSFRRILATWRDLSHQDKVGKALMVRLTHAAAVGRNKNNAPIFDSKIAVKPRPPAFSDYEDETGDAAPTPTPPATPVAAEAEPESDWAA